ncbi:hypothetical protein K469DRAFT_769861 [Zopfia rhizophila CBS 207.26]|uniref:Fungal N-terminal domain-containing protein n=1 Tax=Zopfia rhizophila CBS 207.26 TaxID=1314779 RepID=A0A6A6EDP2_9PEZI|nr:hypothetical protein K469DRAFT_769861 [Zopfia rhizophila CBS 207.26]
MDPISAVGLATGTVQFLHTGGGAFLAMIRLLRDLKDVPKHMAGLLQDLEISIKHIGILREAIEQPSSTLYNQPNIDQVQRVRSTIEYAEKAMTDLRDVLESFLHTQNATNAGRGRKFWKAVVSVTMEDTIEQNAKRILRLNQEVVRELQLITLEVGAALVSRIDEAATSAHADHRNVLAEIDTLKTLIQDNQRGSQDVYLNIGQLWMQLSTTTASISEVGSDVKNFSQVLQSISDRTKEAEVNVSSSHEAICLGQMQLHNKVDSTLDECRNINEKVELLQASILPWITGTNTTFSRPPDIATSFLSSKENFDARIELARYLAERPSGLKRACDNFRYGLRQVKRSHRCELQLECVCSCKQARNRSNFRRGAFSIEYESRTEHSRECQYHRFQKRVWNHTLAVRLLPFLKRTVALTVTRTSGAGGCSMGVFLKSFRTVRRSESEIFKLFDDFPNRLPQRKCDGSFQKLVEDGRLLFLKTSAARGEWAEIRFHCHLDETRCEIDRLSRCLMELLQQGHAWDKDEYGNTILHEVVCLALYVGLASPSVFAQLQTLVELVVATGINSIISPAKPGFYRPYLCYNVWNFHTGTVQELVTSFALQFPEVFNTIPFHDAIGEDSFCELGEAFPDIAMGGKFHSIIVYTCNVGGHRDMEYNKKVLRVLRRYPELTEWEYNPFTCL